MSLRARLVVAVSMVALLALAVAGVATYEAFSRSQRREIDDTLQRLHEPIENVVLSDDDDIVRAIDDVAPGLYVGVLDVDGDLVQAVPAREPGHEALLVDLDDIALPAQSSFDDVDLPTFETVHANGSGIPVRVRVSRLDSGQILIVGLSLEEATEAERHLIEIEAIVAVIALVVAALLGGLLVQLGLRPLRRMEQTALRIAGGGDLDEVVPGGDRRTEVGNLASALNTMLTRIRAAFGERDQTEAALRESEDRMRRFVADVSHELRTPLAAVSAYAELFERGARDHPDDLERALRGIGIETARMHELVEELLLLARLDEGRMSANDSVDLDEILVDSVGVARAVSPEWPISLRLDDVVVVEGDAHQLRQVIDNLLANVRKHTPRGTSTTVELSVDGDEAVIVVADNGPGMTADDAALVFERFYRADPSRSRSSGGAGLGMAIARAIVVSHGGTISIDTAPAMGVRVTIRFPRRVVDEL